MDGDDYPDIRLAVTQGTLLRQPVKFGGSLTSPGTTFTLYSGVPQWIGGSWSHFKKIKWQ